MSADPIVMEFSVDPSIAARDGEIGMTRAFDEDFDHPLADGAHRRHVRGENMVSEVTG